MPRPAYTPRPLRRSRFMLCLRCAGPGVSGMHVGDCVIKWVKRGWVMLIVSAAQASPCKMYRPLVGIPPSRPNSWQGCAPTVRRACRQCVHRLRCLMAPLSLSAGGRNATSPLNTRCNKTTMAEHAEATCPLGNMEQTGPQACFPLGGGGGRADRKPPGEAAPVANDVHAARGKAMSKFEDGVCHCRCCFAKYWPGKFLIGRADSGRKPTPAVQTYIPSRPMVKVACVRPSCSKAVPWGSKPWRLPP